VWDRRALGRGARPAGLLLGHTEGVTHLDARGDGRYLLSNAKDQTARLWDIRKVPPPRRHACLHACALSGAGCVMHAPQAQSCIRHAPQAQAASCMHSSQAAAAS
jgi:hypothetical protein